MDWGENKGQSNDKGKGDRSVVPAAPSLRPLDFARGRTVAPSARSLFAGLKPSASGRTVLALRLERAKALRFRSEYVCASVRRAEVQRFRSELIGFGSDGARTCALVEEYWRRLRRRSFASANDTPPYPTMKLSERVGHPALWLSTHVSEARHGAPGFEVGRGIGELDDLTSRE